MHAFDMAAIAEATGSVISAVLFGALAGAGVLPFPRQAFEAAIRRGGVGVAPSLAAFAAGFETVVSPRPMPVAKAQTLPPPTLDGQDAVVGAQKKLPEQKVPDALLAEISTFPKEARETLKHGLLRAADYQSFNYAKLYMDRLRPIAASDAKHGDGSFRLLQETARQLASGRPTIKTLTAKLTDNPDDAASLYRRGQVYASKGAYNLAIWDFDGSLRLNPKDVEAYNNRCWARTVIGDLQAALKDCNEALRLRPNFVDALDSRGLVNLKSGQAKNAIADFDAALKINPRLTSSLYGRGLAKQRSGAAAEGNLDISNAKAMDPNIAKEFASYGVN